MTGPMKAKCSVCGYELPSHSPWCTNRSLSGLSQLRHVELLEKAITEIPPHQGGRGELVLASMSRDGLIAMIADWREGGSRGRVRQR